MGSDTTEEIRQSIEVGIKNRLKARGLEDSKDVVAVQAVCDQFAAEINGKIEREGVAFDKKWELVVRGETIWIGFAGEGLEYP